MPTVDDIETLERLTLLRVNSGAYRNLGKYVLNLPEALAPMDSAQPPQADLSFS
jgi:hypothetical protein